MSKKGHLAGNLTWVLTDGSVGMENQGLAVAEAVGLPITAKRVKRAGLVRRLPTPLQIHWPPQALLAAITPDSDRLAPPWPRLLISIGRHSVPLALAIRRLSGGTTFALHIQNPRVPLFLFDLVTAPAHDGLKAPGVIVTLGAPHRVTADRLAAETTAFNATVAPLPHPRIAVLLGGTSKAYRFDTEIATEMGERLAALARAVGGSLLVTPSRRTDAAALAALKYALGDVPALVWQGAGPNPYFAFLGHADAIIATEDSVNMITEAAGTGKPLYIYRLSGRSKRLGAFHAALINRGIARPFDGTLATWSYPPVNDTGAIAAVVRQRLGLEPARDPEGQP